MTRTPLSKAVILIIFVIFTVQVGTLIMFQQEIMIPFAVLYFWRLFIMIQSGVFIGLTLACIKPILKLKIDSEDLILRPLGALAAVAMILSIYVIVSVAGVLKYPFLTWRVPILFSTYIIGDWALCLLLYRLHKISNIYGNNTIKLTFIKDN